MPGTLYFYKGTALPYMSVKRDDAFAGAKVMLESGLRHGFSLTEQQQTYIEQLNRIEKFMYQYCNPTSDKGMNRVSKMMNMSVETVYKLWCLNICALLI